MSIFNPKHGTNLRPTHPPLNRASARTSPSNRLANRLLLFLFAIVMLPILGACTQDIGGDSDGWNPPVSVDGTVYIGTKDGEVIALVDDGSGNLQDKWSFPSNLGQGDILGAYNTPLVEGNLVYVNGIDGFLYALDRETG